MREFINTYLKKGNATEAIAEIRKHNKSINFNSHYDDFVSSGNSILTGRINDETGDDIGISIDPISDSIRMSPIIDPRIALVLNERKEVEIG